MKGIHHIEVRNNRVVYKFDVERNITIFRGNSATGKTTLIDLIAAYDRLGDQSGIYLSCDKRCTVIVGNHWKEELERISDSIVFIDEGNRFIASQEFAAAIKNTDNYYVIATRDPLHELPYSVDAIYGIKEDNRYGTVKPVYNSIFRLYGDRAVAGDFDTVITEDSNSGYQFFAHIFEEKGVRCISAEGKSNIFKLIMDNKAHKSLVIVDGAAFGSEMERVCQVQNDNPGSVLLYLPESFEWLILKSDILKDSEISDILVDPSNYIESGEYFSWEQFFTKLLTDKTNGTYLQYNKSNLNSNYFKEEIVKKILRIITIRILTE